MKENYIEITEFISRVTTGDGRLSRGKGYKGRFVYSRQRARSGTKWRVLIDSDNYGQEMTFDPEVFQVWGLR